MSQLLDTYRRANAWMQDVSDAELVPIIAEHTGTDVNAVARMVGITPGADRSLAGSALSSGIDLAQGLGYGAIGAASRAVGADGLAGWADSGVRRNMAESQLQGRPEYERVEDQTWGSALPFLGYQAVKNAPNMAAILGTSALMPQAAIPAGVARGLAFLPKGVGGGGLSSAALNQAGGYGARRSLVEGATSAGNAFGRTVLASAPLGTGAMYSEAVERGDPTWGDAAGALALSPAYGLGEAVLPSVLRQSFGGRNTFSGGLPTRVGKAFGMGALAEAPTETFQNELEMQFAGDLSPEEIASRRLNSAVIGGAVGGMYTAPSGLRRAPGEPIDILNEGQAEPGQQLLLPNNPMPPMHIFPDGSVARNQEEIDAFNAHQEMLMRQQYADQDAGRVPDWVDNTGQFETRQPAAPQNADQQRMLYGDQAFDPSIPPWESSLVTQPGSFDGLVRPGEMGAGPRPPIQVPQTVQRQEFGLRGAPDFMSNNFGEQRPDFQLEMQDATTLPLDLEQRESQPTPYNDPNQLPLDFGKSPDELVAMATKYPNTPVQQWINTLVGVQTTNIPARARKQYEEQLKAAMDEPAGVRANDANGLERELTIREVFEREAGGLTTPTQGAVPNANQAAQAQQSQQEAPTQDADPIQQRKSRLDIVSTDRRVDGFLNDLGEYVERGELTEAQVATLESGLHAIWKKRKRGEPVVGDKNKLHAALELQMQSAANETRRQSNVASKSEDQLISEGYVKVTDGEGNTQLISPEEYAKQQENRGVKGGTTTGNDPTTVQDENVRNAVLDWMGLDTDGNIAGDGLTTRQFADKYATQFGFGNSGQATSNWLKKQGFAQGDKDAARAERAQESEVDGETDIDPTTGEDTTPVLSDDRVDNADLATNALTVTKGTGATSNVDAGRGWQKLLKDKTPLKDWSDTQMAEAATSGQLTKKQLNDVAAETTRRQAKALEKSAAKSESKEKATDPAAVGQDPKASERNQRRADEIAQREAEQTADMLAQIDQAADVALQVEEVKQGIANAWRDARAKVPGRPGRMAHFHELAQDIQRELARIYVQFYRAPDALTEQFHDFIKGVDLDRIFIDAGTSTRQSSGGVTATAATTAGPTGQNEAGTTAAAPGTDGVQGARTTVTNKKRRVVDPNAVAADQPAPDGKLNRRLDPESVRYLDTDGKIKTETVQPIQPGQYPAVDKFLGEFAQGPLAAVLNKVRWFYVSDGPNAYAMPMADGTYVIALSRRVMDRSPGETVFDLKHELAHVADNAAGNRVGTFSGVPSFGITVARLEALWKRLSSTSMLKEALNYPFLSSYPESKNANLKRMEAFAQLLTIYQSPKLAAELRQESATLYQIAEELYNAASRTDQTATPQAAPGRPVRVQNTRDVQGGTPQVLRRGRQSTSPNQQLAAAKRFIDGSPVFRGAFNAITTSLRKLGAMTMFGHDLADVAKKFLGPSVTQYFDTLFARMSERTAHVIQMQKLVEPLGKLSSADQRRFNNVVFDSVFDRDWAFQPDWVKDVKYDANSKAAKAFRSLPADQQKIIKGMFKSAYETKVEIDSQLSAKIRKTLEAQIANTKDAKEKAKLQKELDEKLDGFSDRRAEMKDPYLPLKRWGKLAVVARSQAYQDAVNAGDAKLQRKLKSDANHYRLSFTDSHIEAERIYDQWQADGLLTDRPYERMKYLEQNESIPFSLIQRLKAEVDNKGIESALDNLYIQALEETSIRKTELHRLNVEGADRDMIRAFVEHGSGAAHMLAALKFNSQTQELLQEMKTSQRKFGDRSKSSVYLNEILARHAMALDFNDSAWQKLQSKLMGGTSIWMLLSTPSYYMQNATQPFMLTLPYLAGRFGYAKSWNALTKTYPEVTKLWKNTKSGDLLDISKIQDPGERAMMESLAKLGLMDVGITADMGSLESGRSGLPGVFGDASNKGMDLLNKTHRKLMDGARFVEMYNRTTTAMSSYRLEYQRLRADGKTEVEAQQRASEFAIAQVRHTQGDYSGTNAPRMIEALPFGKLMFQFRKFQLIQIGLLTRVFHGIISNSVSKEEKAVAWAQARFILGHHLAVGGALGLPAANIFAMVMGGLGADEEDPKNFEARARRAIGDKDIADLILKGVPAWAGVDTSSRLGMGMTFSLLPFNDVKYSKQGYDEVIAAILGPSVALGRNVWDGVGLIQDGNPAAGYVQMLPRGLRDAVRSYREVVMEKGIRDRKDRMVLSADDISYFDAIMRGIGWPTQTYSSRWMAQGAAIEISQHFQKRADRLKADYMRAYESGDRAAMSGAMESWANLQDARTRHGFRSQASKLLSDSVKNRREYERNTVGGVPIDRDTRSLVEELLQ